MTRLIVTWQDVFSRRPITGPARTGTRAESQSIATTAEPAIATASMTVSGGQTTAPAPAVPVDHRCTGGVRRQEHGQHAAARQHVHELMPGGLRSPTGASMVHLR